MTPQERQMMAELFTRLASLENSPRDPDAEAMIREGFRREVQLHGKPFQHRIRPSA